VLAMDRRISTAQATVDRLQASEKAQEVKVLTAAAPPVQADKADKPQAPEDVSAITQLRSQLEANRLDIENITKYEAQQKSVIAEYQGRLNLTPVREQELASILRDYDLSKLDYADLLGKEQQSQLATSLEKQQGGQQFRLVEPPSLPSVPSSPQRVKSSMMGVGAGLFIGLALAFVTDLARPAFHTVKEVSLRLGAPLVVGLPVVFTTSENRRRPWKKTFELLCGLVLAAAIGMAEFYVLRHP
jgi:succinoglycan biosynthesis transport protein ExoP